ncbi:uncharacterized protein [Ptychodera flava]|uniref:uncharacterized protein n=1 Tax=Ptychodera flava TaxID=63121 RepID=UPI00396A6BAD
MPYPLFELATLLRVRKNADGDASRHIVDKRREQHVHVRLSAFREFRTKCVTVIALMCDSGFLLLRYAENGKVPVTKQVCWFQHPSKHMECMSFDPSGVWLVCACSDNSICIVPVMAMLNGKVTGNKAWSRTDFTVIEPTNRRAPPTSIVWWHTIDNKDIAIIGTELGELVFVDLTLSQDVAVTDVKDQITSLQLAENDRCSVTYLLIHTVSGGQWRLLLELQPSQWSPGSEQIMKLGFEMLEGRAVSLETFLQSDEFRSDFAPVPFKQFSNQVNLAVQSTKGRNYVAAHDKETNIYKVFDDSVDNWLPLYVYHVPANASHIILTDRLMFAIIQNMGKVSLNVISNQMSETSSPSVEDDINMDSVVQLFNVPDNEKILAVHKVKFPAAYLSDKLKQELKERMPSVSGRQSTVRPGFSPTDWSKEFQKDTVLDGCVVITDAAIYQCRPRVSPEALFLQLAVQYSDTSLAEKLGIVLGLDVNTLYESAAMLRLSKGQFTQAMKLFSLSKCNNMKRVSSFAKYGRMKEILTHLKLVLNKPAELLPNERKQLSNLAVHCYVQQIVECNDKHLELAFKQFLTDSFDYDEVRALKLLAEHGMYELMMNVAKARGQTGQALDIIINKGILQLDIDTTTQLMSEGLSATMATAAGALLRCMTAPDFVHHLLTKPEFTQKYLTAMKSCLAELDVDTLLRIAELFDPSRSTIKMLLHKTTAKRRRRSPSTSSISSAFSTASDSAYQETNLPRPEAIIEFFLEVLLVLNHKRNVLKRTHTGSFSGYQDENLSNDVPSSPLSSPRRRSRVPKQVTVLSCGHSHGAAICHDDLYTWGRAHNGRLGHGEIILDNGKVTPFRVETLHMHRIKVLSVACGREHTLVLCQQGVYGWGSSKYGQVGIGSTQTQTRPVLLTEFSNQKVAAVACGQYHSLALSQNHRVWSWGWGVHGQLGHGDPSDQLLPKQIEALDDAQVTQICAGCCHSAVLTLGGQVMTFGCNKFGQLGNGDTGKESLPIIVDALENYKAVMVTSGFFHMIAVTTNPQMIFIWGSHPASLRHKLLMSKRRRGGHQHQPSVVPHSFETVHLTPRPIDHDIMNRIKQVACGSNHTLIVTVAGELYSMGKNDSGQLAVGTYRVELFAPTLVRHFTDKPILAAAAGHEFSVVVDITGHTWVWGRADHGQLGLESGTGSRGPFHHPVQSGKKQFIGKDVTTPIQLPGLPVISISSDLGPSLLMEELREEDNLSDDGSDSEMDITLPELSRSGPHNTPYSRQCISVVLKHLPSYYNHSTMLRLCQDYHDWVGVADIYEIDKKYIYSMMYRLRSLESKDWATDVMVERAKAVIVSCLRELKTENFRESGTVSIQNFIFLLHQILWFWHSKCLPVQILESLLSEYLPLLAYPLSLILFRLTPEGQPDVSKEESLISTTFDQEETTLHQNARSLLDIPDSLKTSLSTKFCLGVTAAVVSSVNSGHQHKEYSEQLISSKSTSNREILETALNYRPSSQVPEEKLWQEIQYNLKKDISTRQFIQLSSNDVQALLDALKSQIQSNSYRYVPEDGETNVMVFSCGHHFLKQPFLLTTVPFFETAMNQLPVPLPATADIMVHMYRQNGCVPLACPSCVISALKHL